MFDFENEINLEKRQMEQIDAKIDQILNNNIHDPEFNEFMKQFEGMTGKDNELRFLRLFRSKKLKLLCDDILVSNPSPEMIAQVIRRVKDFNFKIMDYKISNQRVKFFSSINDSIEKYIYERLLHSFNKSFNLEVDLLIEIYLSEKLNDMLNRYYSNIYYENGSNESMSSIFRRIISENSDIISMADEEFLGLINGAKHFYNEVSNFLSDFYPLDCYAIQRNLNEIVNNYDFFNFYIFIFENPKDYINEIINQIHGNVVGDDMNDDIELEDIFPISEKSKKREERLKFIYDIQSCILSDINDGEMLIEVIDSIFGIIDNVRAINLARIEDPDWPLSDNLNEERQQLLDISQHINNEDQNLRDLHNQIKDISHEIIRKLLKDNVEAPLLK